MEIEAYSIHMKVFKQTDRQAGIKSERQTDVPRRAFVSCRIGADTTYRNNRGSCSETLQLQENLYKVKWKSSDHSRV